MDDKKTVFVVHGRNQKIKDAVFTFLRAIDLKPLEWEEAKNLVLGAAPYIGDVLAAAFSKVTAILVLFTPDDEAKLRDMFVAESDEAYEKKLTPQARPNVLFEAGMAFGYNPDRTILVEIGKLRPFSDIYGRHTVRLDSSAEKKMALINALRKSGLEPVVEGRSDYLKIDFDLDESITKFDETKSGRLSRLDDEELMEKIPTQELIPIKELAKKIANQERGEQIWNILISRLGENNALLRQVLIYYYQNNLFDHPLFDHGVEALAENNQAEFYKFMKKLYQFDKRQFYAIYDPSLFRNATYLERMGDFIKQGEKGRKDNSTGFLE